MTEKEDNQRLIISNDADGKMESGGTHSHTVFRRGPGGRDPVNTGKCRFAAQQILPKLNDFVKEIEGVKTGGDIEYLHRMRVASRRLRTALPLLSDCYPEKRYQKWAGEIKKISGVLGEARDVDVQIEFLRKYRKQIAKRKKTPGVTPLQSDPPLDQAIRFLLNGVRNRRVDLQKDVVSSLRNFEKQRIVEEIQAAVNQSLVNLEHSRNKPSMRGIPPVAADHLGNRIAALLAFEPWVRYPEAVAEHHAMRIEAKHLRYTLELYAPLYRLGLSKYTRRIAKLQQILGNLHDCDVWIDKVTRIILKERSRVREPGDEERPSPETVTGLLLFLHDREKERKILYRQFARYWSSLRTSGFFEDLCRDILTLRKTKYIEVSASSEEEARSSVARLADIFPEGKDHAGHVTHLALMLFDSLKPVHQLDSRSRFLLECGGLLHDIGLKYGKKGHAQKSAEIIFSHPDLPFDLYERGIIGLIAFWHRGPVRFGSSGYYQIFSQQQQYNLQVLLSLFRIADGLDSNHQGSVSSVSCEITPNEIICSITASTDVEAEKDRALTKSDIFIKSFEKTIVFRSASPSSGVRAPGNNDSMQ